LREEVLLKLDYEILEVFEFLLLNLEVLLGALKDDFKLLGLNCC